MQVSLHLKLIIGGDVDICDNFNKNDTKSLVFLFFIRLPKGEKGNVFFSVYVGMYISLARSEA